MPLEIGTAKKIEKSNNFKTMTRLYNRTEGTHRNRHETHDLFI